MLDVGAEAPRFSLPGVHEGEMGRFALSDYLGESVVVLCFYRADFGPGCRPGDCWLQEIDLLSLQRNVTVLAVGPDTAYSHREFAERTNIDVPLLADTAGSAAETYGVLTEFESHRRVPQRSVFVLDDRGVVQHAWTADDATDRPSVDAVRDAISSVKSDESALERYRRAHDYYRYGESEFEIACDAFEDGEWRLAAEAFQEANGYFSDASDAADAAHWFAASDDVAEVLRDAKIRIDHLARASAWFCKAARHYAAGVDEQADEFRQDAARQRERADDLDPMPEPDELLGEPPAVGA
jgi:peroxiredoxin